MVDYPAHSSRNWDYPLREYIDAADEAIADAQIPVIEGLIDDAATVERATSDGKYQSKDGTIVLPAPTGVTETDNAALAAAITTAGTTGLILARPGIYQISGHHVIGNGVDLRGMGGGSTSKSGRTTFKCMAAGAQIEIGGGGGQSGAFEVDGNLTATTPFKRAGGTGANGRTFHNLTVRANAVSGTNSNDLAEFFGAQNDLFVQCGFADADRDLGHFDQGFGGTLFVRCQWRSAGRYHHYFDSLVAGGPYLAPSDIKFIGGICEGTSGISVVRNVTGGNIAYEDHPIYSVDGCTGPMVDTDTGSLAFHNPFFQSTPSTLIAGTIGVRANTNASVTLTGRAQYFNLDAALAVVGNLAFVYDSSTALPVNTTTVRQATGGGTTAQIGQYLSGGTNYYPGSSTDYTLFQTNAARTAGLFGLRASGRMDWYSGSGFANDVTLLRRAAGAIGVATPSQQVFCTGQGTLAQRPAAATAIAGAIYLNTDTSSIDYCDGTNWLTQSDHTWTNATTSGITTNPYSTGAPVGYTKARNGRVTLRGLAASVAIGSTLFTLPAGYRPGYLMWAPITTLNGSSVTVVGFLQITTAGAVSVVAGAGNIVSFENISFIAEL